MSEKEVELLMGGQEDGSGCINYEGTKTTLQLLQFYYYSTTTKILLVQY